MNSTKTVMEPYFGAINIGNDRLVPPPFLRSGAMF